MPFSDYPLLTEVNVRYWYWECDPHKSGHEIAEEVGCSYQLVYRFMEAKKIPIRDYSESGKVRFDNPEKYRKMMKIKQSEDYLEKQSVSNSEAWADKEKRKQQSERLKRISQKWLSDYQKIIVFILKDGSHKFLNDFTKSFPLNKIDVDRNLRSLAKRGLVSVERGYDPSLKQKRLCNWYSITKIGLEAFNHNNDQEKIDPAQIVPMLHYHKKTNPDLAKMRIDALGKNQKVFLTQLLMLDKPVSVSELALLVSPTIKQVNNGLYHLFQRGILERKLIRDEEVQRQNKNVFKYWLSEKGRGMEEVKQLVVQTQPAKKLKAVS